jgi:hypothetical protein
VPLPTEEPKLLSKEQSTLLSKELVAPVELQQEPEGEEEEENLQFGPEVVWNMVTRKWRRRRWKRSWTMMIRTNLMIFIEQDLIPKKDRGAYNHV